MRILPNITLEQALRHEKHPASARVFSIVFAVSLFAQASLVLYRPHHLQPPELWQIVLAYSLAAAATAYGAYQALVVKAMVWREPGGIYKTYRGTQAVLAWIPYLGVQIIAVVAVYLLS